MLLILLSSFFLGSLSKTWTIDGLIPLYRNGTQIYLYSVHRNKSQEVHLKSILESIASQSIRLIEYSTGWHHCPKVCVCVCECLSYIGHRKSPSSQTCSWGWADDSPFPYQFIPLYVYYGAPLHTESTIQIYGIIPRPFRFFYSW